MWRRDRGQRERGVFGGSEMRDQMATIEAAHRVRHKVDPASRRLYLQEPIELLGARGNRARARHRRHDDFCADELAEDPKDARPVLHAETRGATHVESVQPFARVSKTQPVPGGANVP